MKYLVSSAFRPVLTKTVWLVNPLMANDAFRCHKRFHLLEKGQLSQEKLQMCENHQIHRADFGEKNLCFFGTPPALKRTHGGARGGCPPSRQGLKPLTIIIALTWLLRGRRPHQFASLGGSQCPCTAAPQLCTLCGHAVLANLVNPDKLGGSARLRGGARSGRGFARRKVVHRVEPIMA